MMKPWLSGHGFLMPIFRRGGLRSIPRDPGNEAIHMSKGKTTKTKRNFKNTDGCRPLSVSVPERPCRFLRGAIRGKPFSFPAPQPDPGFGSVSP